MAPFNYYDLEKDVDDIIDENASIKEKYRLLLYERFAKDYEKKHGKAPYSINDKSVIKEFEVWLEKQALLINIYADCLRRLNWAPRKLPTPGNSYIELFKGDVDTLIKSFPEHITVYSSFASTIDPIKARNVSLCNEDVHVKGKTPTIKREVIGKPIYLPFSPFKINTLYVHNPYSKEEERKIKTLLQNDDLNIVFGIYGLSSDPQLHYKINQLSKLFEELLEKNKRTKIFLSSDSKPGIGEYQMGLIYKPRNLDK